MPFYDLTCPNQHEQRDVFLRVSDPRPPCSECGEPTETLWDGKRAGHQDSIEGGLMIEHGLCWDSGEPRRWDSKQAIRKAAKAKGLTWGGFDGESPSGRHWV